MELTEFGFGSVSLMDRERVAFAINAADSAGKPATKHPETLLLTDSRIIYLSGNEKQRTAVIASVRDVEAVEITSNREGYSAYLWAALAVVISIVLFDSTSCFFSTFFFGDVLIRLSTMCCCTI